MTRSRDIADSTKTLDVDGGTIKLDGNYPVGTGNVALGDTALDSLGAGNYNTAVGHNALTANTDGSNTAFGAFSLAAVTTGGNNVAVGREALEANTGDNNTAVGYQAATNNTTGAHNTFLGRYAGHDNTTASDNIAVGSVALYYNTTGTANVAVGRQALNNNTTASNNTAVGYQSLLSNTTGTRNTAVGKASIKLNTTGSNNTAVGIDALGNNSTGSSNTAVGDSSLNNITTGISNTAVGTGALVLNITANSSTALGWYAGGGAICNNGANTFIGETAGYNATSGHNTFIGREAGYYVTSGQKNTILGKYTGNQNGLDIRTTNNNIVLSDGDGNAALRGFRTNGVQRVKIGNGTKAPNSVITALEVERLDTGHQGCILTKHPTTTARHHIKFHNSSGEQGYIICNASSVSYNTSSDHRLKENVDYTWDATTRLKQLKPARFNFIADANTTVDGFLAHEAQAVVPESVSGTHNEVDDDGNAVMQGIDQAKLVPLLVKTIQELEARITALEA
jgi:hypothetical protein